MVCLIFSDADVIQGVLDTAKEPGLASKRLGSDAIARGGTDNVTTIVVFMRNWNKSGKADWD
jgi:serine/threonine protein phosphatase PrpC